jgi:arginyl-tRNA synthetase
VVLDRLADEIRVAFSELVPDEAVRGPAALAEIRLVPPTRARSRARRGSRSMHGDLAFPVGPLLAATHRPSQSPEPVQCDTKPTAHQGDNGAAPAGQLTVSRVAELIAARLEVLDGVVASWADGGFVNIRLDRGALAEIVRDVIHAGSAYGSPEPSPIALEDRASAGRPRHSLPPRLAKSLQYTHARLAGLLRAGDALGVPRDPERLDPAVLEPAEPRQLIGVLADYPGVVARYARGAVRPRAFDSFVARFMEVLERFEAAAPLLPRGDEDPSRAHSTRLLVVEASRVVAANALAWCGLTAPDRM